MSQTKNDPNAAPTLGGKIDAVLEPFVHDEAELTARIDDLERQIESLTAEADDARRDLDVVQSAKIDALRQAVTFDPLLKAAFAGMTESNGGEAEHDEPELVEVEGEVEGDAHRLLSPAG
ncbi:MAG: hypothetical protein AAFX76_09630 [Planctomycetota bacterium]